MVLSWGCLAAVGPTQAPFYQAALLAGGHSLVSPRALMHVIRSEAPTIQSCDAHAAHCCA
jgi:hypothetical protein